MNIENGTQSSQALHVYEVKLRKYPGFNNEIIYLGGYRLICVVEQGLIELNNLNAENEEDALKEITEMIKKNHSYKFV
ncbi:hypothetical protein [Paenisporosarcina sp. OV554]|uniref:hypothetical protein n=1 Tax=Paenisporosarcina sp. OV554 TaxID=2135694 RepID=UPI000D39639D|nr:hypothetical protein [Paenisporosarcina sp. OV554]PUB12518.1 hypothetical protein C8K15_10917 [Paenisporosarcina sp. OV554]